MRAGFAVPDFHAPLDTDAAIAAVPPEARSKGIFLQALSDRIRSHGQVPLAGTSFIGWKDYPGADFCRLLVQCARVVHADVPIREGLRRVGRAAYNDMNQSMAGKVLFGVLGRDIQAITRLASKAYEMSGSPQRADVLEVGKNHSLIRLSRIFSFIDSYQVGVFEGVFDVCQVRGAVGVRMESPSTAEFYSEWT